MAAAVEACCEAGSPVPAGVEITGPGRCDSEKLFALLATLRQSAIDRDKLRPLDTARAASTDVLAINGVLAPPPPGRR